MDAPGPVSPNQGEAAAQVTWAKKQMNLLLHGPTSHLQRISALSTMAKPPVMTRTIALEWILCFWNNTRQRTHAPARQQQSND
mmetsp:Transcript_1745/g.5493  ORF Transcript_1745/g.5493 Transcript_1745/m.5493 type:complete len:83 (+) Transcript_1745:412-660(+)